MAYFVADEKLQGYYVSGGVTINIVKYHFECDDAASLPAQTAFILSKKIKISMASTAHTIDTDALYKMDSSGAWLQQSQPWQPLADYSVLSNKPQINGHTLTGNQSGADIGLQNTLTFDSTPTQESENPVTSGGVWSSLQTKITLNDVYGFGNSIPSNSDIDTYQSIGVYRVESSTVASTVANLPVSAAGRLEVKGLNAANRYLQIFYSSNQVFQRRWTGTAWTSWFEYTLTAI